MNGEWSKTQTDISTKIAVLPRDGQMVELLKWALSRLTHFGPMDDPCAVCVREFLNGGTVVLRGMPEPIGSYLYPINEKEHGAKPFFGKRPLPKEIPNLEGWSIVQLLVKIAGGGYAWINVDERQIAPCSEQF